MKGRYVAGLAVAIFSLLGSFVCGCGFSRSREKNSQEDISGESFSGESHTLWAVTEKSGSTGMNQLAQTLIGQFEDEHEGVTLELEILPTSGEEREARLERLRAEIMAGRGPDIYLLPGDSEVFADPAQAMYNDIFADISEEYDRDDYLDKEGLLETVMDAGTAGESRYILPLRYDIPVAYADMERLKEAGMSENIFDAGMQGLLDELIQNDSKELLESFNLAYYQYTHLLDFFPEVVDYEAQEARLTAEEASHYFRQLISFSKTFIEGSYSIGTDLAYYICNNTSWQGEYGLYFGSLDNALSIAATGKITAPKITMYPLTCADGSLTATVTYYGAVGANCKEPQLAYDFLRRFLLEESQWEQNRRTGTDTEFWCLQEKGWPVRWKGATKPLWQVYWGMMSEAWTDQEMVVRNRQLGEVELTDEDIPVLAVPVDRARFPMSYTEDYAGWLSGSMSLSQGEVPASGEDADKLAEELIRELQKHMAEG